MASTMHRRPEPPPAPSRPAAPAEPPAAPVNGVPVNAVNAANPRRITKPRVGRRVFLVAASTAMLCGAGTLAAPRLAPALEAQAESAARDAVLREIGELEGVSLEAAIRTAEVTRLAVKVILLPLARFVALIGGGALTLLLTAVDAARTVMRALAMDTSTLDAFRAVVISWQGGVSSLPIALGTYLTADIESAETYLRALKRLAEHPHIS
jgi:hypothetical protein